MDAANINIVACAARIDAPAAAASKAPDDGSFGVALKADVAVESSVCAEIPAGATVGKLPVATMRPSDVSSPEEAAKTATVAHEEANADDQAIVADAIKPNVAAQQTVVSLPVTIPQAAKRTASIESTTAARESKKESPKNEAGTDAQCLAADAVALNAATQQTTLLSPLVAPMVAPQLSDLAAASEMKIAKTALATNKGVAKKVDDSAAAAAPASAKIDTAATVPAVPGMQNGTTPTAPAAVTIDPITIQSGAGLSAKHASAANTVTGSPSTSAGLASVRDTTTFVATPGVLEIGIASGTHGWLRIRAELGQMGQVTASLGAFSAAASEGLHKELPAISAYLASERINISSLIVNAMDKGGIVQNGAMSAGTSNQGKRQDEAYSSAGKSTTDNNKDIGSNGGFNFASVTLPAAIYANGSGSWLSVRV